MNKRNHVKIVIQIPILTVFLNLLGIMLNFLALFPPQNQPYADRITIITRSFPPAHSSSTHRTLTHFVTPFLDSTAQPPPPSPNTNMNVLCGKPYLCEAVSFQSHLQPNPNTLDSMLTTGQLLEREHIKHENRAVSHCGGALVKTIFSI